MSNYELGLLENATDSLNEALVKFQEGRDGNEKAYKFCILHFSHFMELIFKYYVAKAHPLLIYKNPFAKDLKKDPYTIGLPEAVQFLKNEGSNISKKFSDDLDWLKKLRNQIEHHKFSMNVTEVEETVGRLMNALHEFDEFHKNVDLAQYVEDKNYDVFNELAKTYVVKLKKAEQEVEEKKKEAFSGYRPKEYNMVNFHIYECPECSNDTLISDQSSSTGYKCTFCGNDDSEEIEFCCGVCDMEWQKWEMRYCDFYGDGQKMYICPRCSGDPEYHPN